MLISTKGCGLRARVVVEPEVGLHVANYITISLLNFSFVKSYSAYIHPPFIDGRTHDL